jgi:peptide methionine sulfoxide reductase MsrB
MPKCIKNRIAFQIVFHNRKELEEEIRQTKGWLHYLKDKPKDRWVLRYCIDAQLKELSAMKVEFT